MAAHSFNDRLEARAREVGHLLCLGIDPDLERLPLGLDGWETFVNALVDRLEPAALKPNAAYFEALGSSGWAWLERLVARVRGRIPVILDGKRGDIGPSSRAYARSAFEHLGADALTVSPWMGHDSLQPFLDYAPQHGLYVLVRTSNPGHATFQGLRLEGGQPVWQRVYEQVRQWGTGAVVGATNQEDLAWCASEVPLLIPGVGTQGGEAREVIRALGPRRAHHRVNVSSKIVFACEEGPQRDPLEAAVAAFERFAGELPI